LWLMQFQRFDDSLGSSMCTMLAKKNMKINIASIFRLRNRERREKYLVLMGRRELDLRLTTETGTAVRHLCERVRARWGGKK
jgi:hypothetical protein